MKITEVKPQEQEIKEASFVIPDEVADSKGISQKSASKQDQDSDKSSDIEFNKEIGIENTDLDFEEKMKSKQQRNRIETQIIRPG